MAQAPDEPIPSALNKYIAAVLRFAVAAAILVFLLKTNRLDLTLIRKSSLHPGLLATALLLLAVTYFFAAWRWQLLLRGQGMTLRFPHAIALTLVGAFFNLSLPGAVSGDVMKGYFAAKQDRTRPWEALAGSLLMDRFSGLCGLIVVACSASAYLLVREPSLTAEMRSLSLLSFVLLLVAAAFTALLFAPSGVSDRTRALLANRAVLRPVSNFYLGLLEYRRRPSIVARANLISVIIHGLLVAIVILVAAAILPQRPPLAAFFIAVPLGLLAIAVPITPVGLGVGQVAFAFLLDMYQVQGGAEIFTVYVSLQILISLLGGIVFTFRIRIPQRRQARAIA